MFHRSTDLAYVVKGEINFINHTEMSMHSFIHSPKILDETFFDERGRRKRRSLSKIYISTNYIHDTKIIHQDHGFSSCVQFDIAKSS